MVSISNLSLFEHPVLPDFVDQQDKKIYVIAAIAICAIVALYFLFRCCCFKAILKTDKGVPKALPTVKIDEALKTLTFSNGDVYVGDIVDGKAHGQGTYTKSSGEIYTGDFADGHPNGKGIETFPNGDRFEGHFENNDANGRGKYIFADGTVCEANWKNGKVHGKGIVIYLDGTKEEQDWENGMPVNKSSLSSFVGTVVLRTLTHLVVRVIARSVFRNRSEGPGVMASLRKTWTR